MKGPLGCRVYPDYSGWTVLQPHWDRLLADTPDSTPWQSFEWLHAWWTRLAGARRLRLVVVEREGIPCLVLPLQLAEVRMFGFPMRVLEPIGMPDDINRPAFALGIPDQAALARALVVLLDGADDWDVIRIDEKREDDPELASLRALATTHGLSVRTSPLHPCPRLDLRQDWDKYLASRGRRLAKNLRAARRRLEAHGPVVLTLAQTPGQIAAAFEAFLAVHAVSWKHRECLGLGRSEAFRAVYRAFLAGRAETGQARVLLLRAGPWTVAGSVAIIDRGTWYAAQIAHDEAFAAASPGTLLESLELEMLMREQRCTTYDFFGGALNNKRRWTDDAPATVRVLLFRRRGRTRLVEAWYFNAKPALKRLRAAFR